MEYVLALYLGLLKIMNLVQLLFKHGSKFAFVDIGPHMRGCAIL